MLLGLGMNPKQYNLSSLKHLNIYQWGQSWHELEAPKYLPVPHAMTETRNPHIPRFLTLFAVVNAPSPMFAFAPEIRLFKLSAVEFGSCRITSFLYPPLVDADSMLPTSPDS